MKLLRYGPKGKEKPGVVDTDGRIRDISSIIDDITPDVLGPTALAALGKEVKAKMAMLPLVSGKPRLGVPVATAGFVDAGLVTNALSTVRADDIRPAAGMALRLLTPLGAISGEYAIPLLPRLGDDPRGRFHLSVALRY